MYVIPSFLNIHINNSRISSIFRKQLIPVIIVSLWLKGPETIGKNRPQLTKFFPMANMLKTESGRKNIGPIDALKLSSIKGYEDSLLIFFSRSA